MTLQPVPEASCVVCGTVVTRGVPRCPGCGLARPTATGHQVLARAGFWAVGALFLVAWVVALTVVATAR